ncbi:MAG: DNA-binding protein [Geovibrio sp.]|nr:DNA-binding protein [Geovibrio sp.]
MKSVWYKEAKLLRTFIIKIQPGEDLVEKLAATVREIGIDHAVVTSALGSVTDVKFRGIKAGAKLPITVPRMTVHNIEGPLELLGLSGNFFPDASGRTDCHLHIQMSKSSGEVIGGHLFSAKVFASCEIMISELHTEGIERHYSKTGGTATIFIEEEHE